MSHGIKLLISGDYACFTRPELKAERYSYDVITPSAARGILEAIHWKPAIRWQIDRIHVLKPIRFRSVRRNEVTKKVPAGTIRRAMEIGEVDTLYLQADAAENRMQRATTLLVDVAYVIEARFQMTRDAGPDDNPGKHLAIFNRRASAGQCFHRPCLGCREFPADFRLLDPPAAVPPPIGDSRDLGLMLWDIDHGREDKPPMFFRARMDAGVVHIPSPGSVEIYR